MKKIALFLFALILIPVSAQRVITKKFEMSNKTEKLIKIYLPKGIENDTVHKYPLTIVLDDDYLFDMTVGNAKIFAGADLAPRQIIVGVPTNRNENMDISIVKETQVLTRNSTVFYNFIKNDLIKYMRAKYKTSPFKTIVGDRKAANYALYFTDEREPLFNSFLILDPIFSKEANMKLSTYKFSAIKDIDNTYFLYISTSPYITAEEKAAQKELETALENFKGGNFKIKVDENLNDLNGVENISKGIPKGLSFSYNSYRCITKQEYKTEIDSLAPLSAIEYLEKKYIDINYLYGTNINVRIKDFYAIESKVIDEEDGDHLSILGDFALMKHPKSALGDFYMGKFNEAGKNYEIALDYYKTGFGKMEPSDPKIDDYYKNIGRVNELIGKQPKNGEEKASEDEEDPENEEEEEEEPE